MNTITAINKAHQSLVNRAYKFYRAYYAAVDLDGTFDTNKEQHANDRKQLKQFELYACVFEELPKREQLNFDRQHKAIHGYT